MAGQDSQHAFVAPYRVILSEAPLYCVILSEAPLYCVILSEAPQARSRRTR